MALTATFQADFDQFSREVKTALGELKAFDKETAKAIKSVKDETSSLASSFQSVTGVLAGVFSAGAIKAAIGAYADFTGQLTDLSAKTGIGVESLQKLKYAAEQNGASIDLVTGAVVKLGTNLAGGNKGATGAIKALGLSLEAIKGMAPDQQFTTLADAIAKVEDPMDQAKLAMDLFGKSGAELLPAMKGNLSETADQAAKLGLVLSEDAVAAGDKFGDSMGTLSLAGQILIARVLEPMIPALTAVAEWIGTNLPNAFSAAQQGFDALIRKALEGQVALFEMAVKAAEFAEKMPTLRAATGQAAEDTKFYKEQLQFARDQLESFNTEIGGTAEATEKTAASTKKLALDYEGQAKAATDAEKAEKEWQESLKKGREELIRMDTWLTKLNASLTMSGDELVKATERLNIFTNKALLDNLSKRRQYEDELTRLVEERTLSRFEFQVEEIKRWADAQKEALDRTAGDWEGNVKRIDAIADEMFTGLITGSDEVRDAVASMLAMVPGMEGFSIRLIGPMNAATDATKEWHESLSTVATAFSQLANVAGGSLGTVGSVIGSIVTGLDAGVKGVQALGQGLKAGLGSLSGFASFSTGIASIFGAATAVASIFKGLFGVSEEVKKAREELEKFEETLANTLTEAQQAEAGTDKWKASVIAVRDAFIAVGRSEEEALRISAQLFNTDNPAQMKAAMEEINKVLKEQKKFAEEQEKQLEKNKKAATGIFDDLIEAADKAGGVIPPAMQAVIDRFIEMGLLTEDQVERLRDLEAQSGPTFKQMDDAMKAIDGRMASMGQGFRQAKIDETAGKYLNAIDTLIRGGADVGGVLFDAKEEMSKLVQEAIKSGATLPAQMQPWIKELSRAGLLVDETTKEVIDLKNLKFGPPMKTDAEKAQEAFEKITKAVQDLVEAIERQLGPAIRGIPAPNVPVGSGGGGGGGGNGEGGGGGNGGDSEIPFGNGDGGPETAAEGRGLAAGMRAGGFAPAIGPESVRITIPIDGRVVADVVLERIGGRYALKAGAR